MALLGHSSAEMSLRYGRFFDATVRADHEHALTLAKERLGRVRPDAPTSEPEGDWRELPLIKSRMAGGFCLAAPLKASALTPTSASTARTTAPSRLCSPSSRHTR